MVVVMVIVMVVRGLIDGNVGLIYARELTLFFIPLRFRNLLLTLVFSLSNII